jgi:hypothetical protein
MMYEHFLFVEKWWEILFIYFLTLWNIKKIKLVGGDDGWCLCFFHMHKDIVCDIEL